ncbi:tRNA 2-selenouridine(34) synthase MnmH [Syntrophotalea acetylenivorans]|uniref:tRNA 2-selenouridine(34) synthase MnmH n=1 Tax=Syntrophotalea acetylenivorans TaxID=1842532 RepID=A0A1L3GQU1_9BACT|nr:tRNA 2-selenouridine(34) synthase MnmH [Syntrophotalea acetylenivorans]APG28284.1 tRNA 2-selenouridine(34) synthase MnmH [Syntrophotalea acetylenivorans]
MSQRLLTPEAFLQRAANCPVFDARTPGEYGQAHIPGAYNLPLFSDEERHQIGILYKNQGKETAVLRGLEMVGPRLTDYIARVREITDSREILVHCWRGGMRSSSLAWLLETVGYRVALLKGGYKAYRRQVQATLAAPWPLLILSGMTGSGKTELLQNLRRRGEQVLDLEGLANHRGSAFGAIDGLAQPTTEQFENEIGAQLQTLVSDRPIWVEDESRRIGRVVINDNLYKQMRKATVIKIDVPRERRVERLCIDYGNEAPEKLAEAVTNISKRLGGEKTSATLQAITNGDISSAAHAILDYYDKTYLFGLKQRDPQRVVMLTPTPERPGEIARSLIELSNNLPAELKPVT